MKLKFLGTGAADWLAPSEGFYRANASVLVDGRMMIDGTMRVLGNIEDPGAVTDILYTHSHSDHFDPALLKELAPIRAHAHRSWAGEIRVPGVEVVPFDTLEDFEVAGLRVTALTSNHSTERAYETTVHYIVRGGGRALLYATDGAWLTNAQWHALRRERLDAAIFDATVGEMYPSDFRIFEHNTVGMVRAMTRMLRAPMNGPNPTHGFIEPVLKPEAQVYLTHLARTLHPSHEEVAESCAGEFIVAYDGLEIEV